MQKEKIRVYVLARELNLDTKDLLDMCQQAGIEVRNQLSSLDPEQRDVIEEIVKRGKSTPAAPSKSAAPVVPSVTPGKIPTLAPMRPRVLEAKPAKREPEPPPVPSPVTPVTQAPPVPVETPAVTATPAAAPPKPIETPPIAARAPEAPPRQTPAAPAPSAPVAPAATTRPPETPTAPNAPTVGRPRDLNQARPGDAAPRPQQRRQRDIPRPSFVRSNVPPPLKKTGGEDKKPAQPQAQKPIAYVPKDVAKGGGPINVKDLLARKPAEPGVVPPVDGDEDDEAARKGGASKRPGGVVGRDQRHAKRNERARARKEPEVVGGKLVLDEDDRPQKTRDRLRKIQQRQKPTQPRKGKVPIQMPITVRSLSEAMGLRSVDLLFRLKDLGAAASITINSVIDPVMAETVAEANSCELDIKRPLDAEEQLLADFDRAAEGEELVPRAPIVTIMGHVDHGKTSLLDKIRVSNVAATEAGGITQVIRAWRVPHAGKYITFLDTPGHEAFTKMRARGANVTDIAVIVVAADDGVMPQTEEAINHARAAGVSMIVAINKVDLPNANLNKTRQQLYSLNVLPDNMGGDVPFVETSAATGKGIFDADGLLDQISVVAELKELKANANKPARGTCLEANLTEGEGVFATLLVQSGTLHKGDVALCGASYGRVRAMYNDLGQPIDEAGPSVPVRITGLNEVPNADDPFQVVPELTTAREIADKRQTKQQEAAQYRREPVKLENLSQVKIAELKVILKADFRGSVEAIRKELEKLHHEEVRVRILEAAIGAITENDVWLALTSPEDTLIVGFNVVPDDRARQVAEERGVQIRLYNIIYDLTNDIRSALEGKLKPREEIVYLGRAVVRDTFKISRVGTIAGCYVTQGIIERSAKVQVIREGVIVYPPAERTASLESLKRFKEDVREVREGFECGIKIAGYDDIKVGDVISAYRVEHIQRTLEK